MSSKTTTVNVTARQIQAALSRIIRGTTPEFRAEFNALTEGTKVLKRHKDAAKADLDAKQAKGQWKNGNDETIAKWAGFFAAAEALGKLTEAGACDFKAVLDSRKGTGTRTLVKRLGLDAESFESLGRGKRSRPAAHGEVAPQFGAPAEPVAAPAPVVAPAATPQPASAMDIAAVAEAMSAAGVDADKIVETLLAVKPTLAGLGAALRAAGVESKAMVSILLAA